MKFFFIVLLLFSFSLFGCKSKYDQILKDNTAELRMFLLQGSNDNVEGTLICGKREKDYVINGYATELIEFGVITFKLNNLEDYDYSNAHYVLFVGTTRYDGKLERNPFDDTLVADIKKIINPDENVTTKLNIGNYSVEMKMFFVGKDWRINYNDVYNIIIKNYKPQLDLISSDNIFNGEVYIKIINDADKYKGDYYWYVIIVSRNGEKLTMIISPISGEILAQNNSIE